MWRLVAAAILLSALAGCVTSEGPYSRTEFIMLPESAKTCRVDFKIGPKPTDLTLQKFSCR